MGQLDKRRRYVKIGGQETPGPLGPNYLSFTPTTDGTFTLTISQYNSVKGIVSVSYSIDNGVTWVTTPNIDNTEVVITTPTISAGKSVLWKGNATSYAYQGGCSTFSSTCSFRVGGNIMSLLYGDNFEDKNYLPSEDYTFMELFKGCSGMLTPPEVPATQLANYCYWSMFEGCSGLTNAPELPSTTLATTCYCYMFAGCTSLTTAPVLPATTLQQGCYSNMFRDCTALTTPPELPATNLANGCYRTLFLNCVNLTTAPVLPATTLVSNCYSYMFQGCSNLKYIKMLSTTRLSSAYSNNWVSGVSSSGTFVRNSSAWHPSGVHGVPSGWTIQTASS